MPLNETKHSQMRDRLRPIISQLENICSAEKITMNLLLGLVGRSYYLNNHTDHYNYEMGNIFQQIYDGKDPYEFKSLSVDQGIYLLEKLEIGKTRYR